MQPFNFRIDVPSALDNVRGLNAAKREMLDIDLQQEKLLQARAQMKASQDQQARFQDDLADVINNPSTKNVLALASKHPGQMKDIEKLMSVADQVEKRSTFEKAVTLDSLMSTKSHEEARGFLEEMRQGAINSGDDALASMYEGYQAQLDASPELFTTSVKLLLRSSKEGREYLESRMKEEEAKSNIDFKNFDKDMKKLEVKLKMEQLALSKEDNALKREELLSKVKETQAKIEEKQLARTSEFNNAASSIDNMINTVDRALSMDKGDVFEDVLGPVSSRLPTVGQDEADFEDTIDLLSNQAFLAVIPTLTGLGALSDAEGRKLMNSIQSFSLKQSPESMRKSLKETKRLMLKARGYLSDKFGVDQPIVDTPDSIRTIDEINLTPESSDEIGRLIDQYVLKQGS